MVVEEKKKAPAKRGPTEEEYEALWQAHKALQVRVRKSRSWYSWMGRIAAVLILVVALGFVALQAETLMQALTVLNEWSWEMPASAPLPTAQVDVPPAAPAQVDPAAPAPALSEAPPPVKGELGGKPNQREAPPVEVQAVPKTTFGGKPNVREAPPVVEVQAAPPPPTLGGRPNESGKGELGGKPKK